MTNGLDDTCAHCGGALPADARDAYCCIGCRFVHRLLRDEGLERYYSLRGPMGDAVGITIEGRDRKWLEPIEADVARSTESGGITRVDLDVQGLSCAACVWLIEQLFRREVGAARVVVNPALGSIALTIDARFPLRRFVERVESCGYLLGPARKDAQRGEGSNRLLLRMGLCIAFAMNGMIVAVALYAGAGSATIGHFFRAISFGFATASVLVGGSFFFQSAFAALRRGILHLDLPIALGIALAYASSTWAWLAHDATGYFDPLSVFVALMLVGRFLQQRVLEANRRRLLADDGVDALLTRRIGPKGPVLVRCVDVKNGDALLLAPGDVVPVDATLIGNDSAELSLDWINGESAHRTFNGGATLPAGSFLAGNTAREIRASQSFGESVLVELLRTPARASDDGAVETGFWRSLAQWWVVSVLILALGALIVGLRFAPDPAAALDRVTAVLIVTCPCAFGIAAPLAYEVVQARLRRAGLFVRTTSFLDRAATVRRVVFDKTGTLTTGKLRVKDLSPLTGLDETQRSILRDLATRSGHPKSAAVVRALDAIGSEGFRADLVVREETGRGVETVVDGVTYRLGSPAWISPAESGDVVFAEGGRVLAAFETTEDLRADAAREVAELRDAGYEVAILSGDSTARVHALARRVGVREADAFGDQSPRDKAEWVKARDAQDTLVIGDGINDGPVVAIAYCSGTPAIDRPFLAARSDFYLVGAGLAPIRTALDEARRLHHVLRVGLWVAVAYNVVTVGLAYAGIMTPLLCAVLMPLSSLSTILAVLFALAGKTRSTSLLAEATWK